ncbi:hypothetical protein AALB52_24905, partial [Lachnospiraceae bacterium 38-14]
MPRISVIGQVLPELKKRKRVAAYARVSMETEMLLHSLSAQVSHYNGLIVVFQIKRAANLQIILAPYKIDVVLQ